MEVEAPNTDTNAPNLAIVKSEYDADTDTEQDPQTYVQQGEISEPTSVMSENEVSGSGSGAQNEIRQNLIDLTNNLQEKGGQLWNELHLMLTQYKAELHKAETFKLQARTKLEHVNDVEELKNELIDKENENMNLRQKLNEIEAQNQTIQMDISVKDSLLKKYQQDLLDKESAVMSLQNTNQKLESRIGLLETKLQNRPSVGSPAKTMLSPAGRGLISSVRGRGIGMRGGLGGIKRSSMSTFQATPPKRTPLKPFQPRLPRQPAPVRLTAATNAPVRLPTSVPTRLPTTSQPMRLPTTPQKLHPSPQSQPADQGPIVCIELDDDDEISEVNQATEQVGTSNAEDHPADSSDSVYTERTDNEQWTEPKTEDNGQDVPSYFDQSFGSQPDFSGDMNQPLMLPGTSDGSMDNSGMLYDAEALQLMQESMGTSPGKLDGGARKVFDTGTTEVGHVPCPVCGKVYKNSFTMTRHYRIIHEKLLKYSCAKCSKRFGTKHQLEYHMNSYCTYCSGQFCCKEDYRKHTAFCNGMRPYANT